MLNVETFQRFTIELEILGTQSIEYSCTLFLFLELILLLSRKVLRIWRNFKHESCRGESQLSVGIKIGTYYRLDRKKKPFLFSLLLNMFLDFLINGLNLISGQQTSVETLLAEWSNWINLLFNCLYLNLIAFNAQSETLVLKLIYVS